MKAQKFTDPIAIVVIFLTVTLFILALFIKGFTHDVLLEAAVFLVSAKLILMSKHNAVTESRLEARLEEIRGLLVPTAGGERVESPRP